MKITSFKLTWFLIILGLSFSSAKADKYDTIVDKYVIHLNGGDGTGRMIAVASFAGEVPVQDRADVLARILDKLIASKSIDVSAISGVYSAIDTLPVPLNARLKKSVRTLASCSVAQARAIGVAILAQTQGSTDRKTILDFQKDPDDNVRASLINGICKWSDAIVLYRKYIQEHERDPRYTKSVKSAKEWLGILTSETK